MPLIQWIMNNLNVPTPTPEPVVPSICFRFRIGDIAWVNCCRATVVSVSAENSAAFYVVKIGQELVKVPECALATECNRPILRPVMPSISTVPIQGKKNIKTGEDVGKTVKTVQRPVLPSIITVPVQGKKNIKVFEEVEKDPMKEVIAIQKILDKLSQE